MCTTVFDCFVVRRTLTYLKLKNQCWGSVTFWCGSGFPDPYLYLMDTNPVPDPDPTPDPTPFSIDFKDAKKNFFSYFFLITCPQALQSKKC
jgi:hypothetical protein